MIPRKKFSLSLGFSIYLVRNVDWVISKEILNRWDSVL